MMTVLYIHNPYLPSHINTASEVKALGPPPCSGCNEKSLVPQTPGKIFIVQGDFSQHPPLWHSQQKEYGNDEVRREAFLMAYQDKMRGAPLMEVTCTHQETLV